ncbi:MAG: biopolymer transporter ExbD [Bdellovibrionaceae bacterium]|nr:biopolymer transporter ExbD [Pseudobdellovibrionaceae bacterium]
MRKRFKPKISHSYEFELDLAPLLAVMVKLVPVLLISSAFVQVMVIETDLPQAVKEAVQNQEDNKDLASVQIDVSRQEGIKVIVAKQGQQSVEKIPVLTDGSFDLPALHKQLQKVKAENPKVFRLELVPGGDISYNEIVKIMDEARKSRDKDVRFPVWDSTKQKDVETDYMFPDVTFANVMEG